MEISNSTQQLTTDELKIRELAQDYLKIQENTQYLTHLIRYTSRRYRIPINLNSQLLQMKSLASLTVQIAYLLFTCYIKQTNLFISQQLLYMYPNRKDIMAEVICEYILEKDFVYLREDQQKILLRHFKKYEFNHKNLYSFGLYALEYVNTLIGIARSQFDKLKLPNDKLIFRHFMSLQSIVKKYIEPQIQVMQHPRVVILSFQQSELFRQHSILVKVMNNSLFSSIRNSKNKLIFQEITKLQSNLVSLKMNKHSNQNNSKDIEKAIQNLLLLFIKNQIMTVQQSLNDQVKKQIITGRGIPAGSINTAHQNMQSVNQGARQYILGQVQGNNVMDRKYCCKVLINQKPIQQFSSKVYEGLVFEAINNYSKEQEVQNIMTNSDKNKQSIVKNQFLIEYFPAKGMLSVKYITPIELNIQNTDLVMFQCNNIAYHWSNVSMQLIQKSQTKIKRKQRYLALKTISHLQIAEKPLFKLMLMIDLVMLSAKIAQPELKKNMIRVQDYNKIEEISRKVEHMIQLFIRKVQKYYKMIAESQTSNADTK